MSHPKTIFIDSSVQLAEHIARRLSAEVRNGQAAAEKAEKRGAKDCAQRHKQRWVAYDELGGLIETWTQDFLSEHRANVLRSLIESWPRPVPDIIDDDEPGEEFDNDDEELAEAAD